MSYIVNIKSLFGGFDRLVRHELISWSDEQRGRAESAYSPLVTWSADRLVRRRAAREGNDEEIGVGRSWSGFDDATISERRGIDRRVEYEIDSALRDSRRSTWSTSFCWSRFPRETTQNIFSAATQRIRATKRSIRSSWLRACNGSAMFRITLCVARWSQFTRAKFIPEVFRDARSIVLQIPAMTLGLF
jgi:hypothetical protein